MRILLKFVLDCDPDVAWDAIRSPSILKDVSFPLASFTSLEHGGFPAQLRRAASMNGLLTQNPM